MTDSADPRADRALAHLEGLTAALGFLLGFLLLAGVLLTVFGPGSFLGIGDEEVCASTRPGEVPWGANERRAALPGLEPDARWHTETIGVCVDEPGLGVRLGALLRPLTEVGLFVGSLLLIRRVIRLARRHGLFAPGVATRVQTLGRFLVVAAPVSALLVNVSDGIVLDVAVRGTSWHDHLLGGDFSWTLLIAGVGIVSMAKVIAYARVLQDDADRTI